jgi:hypothetical protein
MARKQSKGSGVTGGAMRSASWMSLVAATTLGIPGVDQVRAHISAGRHPGDGDLRLIVQSYSRDALDGNALPKEHAEPLASTQRAVTAEELRDGVDVSFLQLPNPSKRDSVVVAWVENGAPDLDYDALQARPHDGTYYGVAQRRDGEIMLRLGRG